MYLNDFSVKEVNAYYARRGGIRTASVKGYANAGSFSGLLQRAAAQTSGAAQASRAAQTSQAAQANRAAQASPAAQEGRAQAHSARAAGTRALAWQDSRKAGSSSFAQRAAAPTAAQPADSSGESAHTRTASDSGSANVCCEQCHATNQLMLQMMSRNLYAQSALNYPLTGYGSWTAYQNMADLLGKSLF